MDGGNDKAKERDKEQDESVSYKKKETKIGHRRIDEDGQITYKKVLSTSCRACRLCFKTIHIDQNHFTK